MEHAKLWKRILNEGIRWFPPLADTDGLIMRQIILATNIVFPPSDERGFTAEVTISGEELSVEMISRAVNLMDYRFCCVPFDLTWIERVSIGDITGSIGHLFIAEKNDVGHRISVTVISESPEHSPAVNGIVRFDLDTHGSYVEGSIDYELADQTVEFFMRHVGQEGVSKLVLGIASESLEELMMLGARNISLAPNPIEDIAAKRAAKRCGGDASYFRYHTLEIVPSGSKPGTRGDPLGVMPRHLCRGHWAEYGKQFGKGLLFGKYEGRFYIPPTIKGDKKNGVVEKDYELPGGGR